MSEIGEARALLRSRAVLLLPVILDGAQVPSVISDIYAIVAPERNVDELVTELDQAIKSFQAESAKDDPHASGFPTKTEAKRHA